MGKIQIRYIHKPVDDDLKHKMVFISSPRQVGKITFGLTFPGQPYENQPAYLVDTQLCLWHTWVHKKEVLIF